jgi:hypothetical protein
MEQPYRRPRGRFPVAAGRHGNVEPVNTDGPILAALSSDTGYGHKFVDIYMNPSYKLLPAIKALADSNLQALQSPTP